MKKTGDLLRKVREEKGLSLHEIGLSLKINPKILKQIEDGEKNNLPAKTFLRGFVQSYANFLKLDSDEVLRIFSEEMGSTKPQQIPTGTPPDAKTGYMTISEPREDGAPASAKTNPNAYNKKDFEFKNFGIGALVILLLLSLIGVRKVVEKYQKESEIEPPKISEEATNANPIPTADSNASLPGDNPLVVNPNSGASTESSASIPVASPTAAPAPATTLSTPTPSVAHTTVAPAPTPTATATISAQSIPAASALKPTTSSPSLPVPALTATPTTAAAVKVPTPMATAKPTPAVAPTPTPTPTVAPTTAAKPEEIKKPKNVEVVIQALDSVDVEVTLSSGKSEIIKLSPSQTQTIKSQTGVKLNFSNGGAVNLIVNGKDMGVPGDLGKPKKVSF